MESFFPKSQITVAKSPLSSFQDSTFSGKDLVQALFFQEPGQQIRYLHIIQIGEWEMRIALDPYFRQMYHGNVAPVLINHITPLPRHLKAGTPSVYPGILNLFFRNKITIIYNDRDFSQFQEIRHRNGIGENTG